MLTVFHTPFLRAIFAVSVSIWLTACSPSDTDKNTQDRFHLEYASMKDIRDINPHLYLGEMAAQAMVFEPLVINTAKGVEPWLAKSWDISADGKTYTFHLREGVRYTDGHPFTAQSVEANVDAILENKIRHAWLNLVNEIESHRALDELTWELHLKHPYFPTLIELGVSRPFRFISPACMDNGHTNNGVKCLAGTGPWKLSEHKRNQYAVFSINETYWGEKPKLKSIRWNVLPDAQTMLMALQKGEIDLIFGADGDQLTSDALSMLQKSHSLSVSLSEPIASRAILLNTKRAVTADSTLRLAIAHAIDRQAIAKGVLNNLEEPAPTLFARNVPYCDVDLKIREYSPQKARDLLDQAGWFASQDGIREKNGIKAEVAFYYNAQNAQERTIAEVIQADLAQVGIKVNLFGEEKQIFLDRQRSGDFDLQYALSWGAPYDPQSYLSSWRIPAHGDYQAQLGLPNKEKIDRLIGDFMIEMNEDKRQALVSTILETIHNADVYVPISYSRTKAVHTPSLKGVDFKVSQYEIPFESMYFESGNQP